MWEMSWVRSEEICGSAKEELIGRRSNKKCPAHFSVRSKVLQGMLCTLYELLCGHVFKC